MLRQIHIFFNGNLIYVKDYAIAFGSEELNNVKKIIQKYIDMPMPGRTFHRNLTDFQIFHRAYSNLYFLFIADIIDSLQYIDPLIIKTIDKFKELFPNPKNLQESIPEKEDFLNFLNQIQRDLHSKIALIGPSNSGKTTLFNMLKSGDEKTIMEVAKSVNFEIDGIRFDLWDFQLKDNFSLLWSKFIKGSDLVILLFNLANYNLKMINHFLNLQKRESPYSKLLIIGNKRDLVEDSDLRRIKNELNIPDFREISLNSIDARSQILDYIVESLGLKEKKPADFEKLTKEAENLVLEGKNVQALAKYKELITLTETYHDIMATKTIEQKITELNNKIQKQSERRRESEIKKDFEITKPLLFSRKITVKPLPHKGADAETPSTEQEIKEEPLPLAPKKPTGLVSFQQLDKEIDMKPLKIPKSSLKITKKVSIPQEIEKEISPIKFESTEKPKAKMPMEIFGEYEDIKKEIKKPLVIDFTKELQKMIISRGSSLSLNLCENLILELGKSLGRPITIDDLEMAAEFFVKQEQVT
ncbi:MAG: ADP-ribosylation factor-like protein [Candidatus Thorarchaeota archaeon]